MRNIRKAYMNTTIVQILGGLAVLISLFVHPAHARGFRIKETSLRVAHEHFSHVGMPHERHGSVHTRRF